MLQYCYICYKLNACYNAYICNNVVTCVTGLLRRLHHRYSCCNTLYMCSLCDCICYMIVVIVTFIFHINNSYTCDKAVTYAANMLHVLQQNCTCDMVFTRLQHLQYLPMLHKCYTCVTVMLHVCYTYVTRMLHLYVTLTLHICYTYVTLICYTYVTHMLHLCYTYTLHLCYTYVTQMLHMLQWEPSWSTRPLRDCRQGSPLGCGAAPSAHPGMTPAGRTLPSTPSCGRSVHDWTHLLNQILDHVARQNLTHQFHHDIV